MRAGVVAEQLFVAPPGGIGRYVRALVEHLPVLALAGGDEVRWIAGRRPPAALAAAGLDPSATVTVGLPGRVATRLWVELRWPALPRAVRAGLDLVHATSAAVPPARGRPLVATIHDLAFHHYPDAYPRSGRHFHERGTRIAAATAARLLVPSEATARDLAAFYGVERERVTVVPLGVDPPAAPADHDGARALLARLGVPGPFLLTVGTVQPRKNLPRLLAAFAAAVPELGDHHLVVVGPSGWGPRLAPPPAQAGRVRLAGPVGERTLHALYAAADAVALPSLYEGFGLPVLEAMAHGTPVLTSNRSSLPEVAGDAALLVDPLDEHAIATGLVSLVRDQAMRERLAAAGPARAARYPWSATAEATWRAYQEALA